VDRSRSACPGRGFSLAVIERVANGSAMPSGGGERWGRKLGRRCRIAGQRSAASLAAKTAKRRRIDHPGRTLAALDLKPLDGGLGPRSVQAIHRTRVVAQASQHALYLPNALRAPRISIAGARTEGIGATWEGTQRCFCLRPHHAVRRKAMCLLEAANRSLGPGTVEAIDRPRGVPAASQTPLERTNEARAAIDGVSRARTEHTA
jgi:hypothetical protein